MRKLLLVIVGVVCGALMVTATTPAAAHRGGGLGPHRHVNPSLKWGVVRGTVGICGGGDATGTLVYLEGINAMAKLGPEGTYALYFVPRGEYTLVIEHPGVAPEIIPGVIVRKWMFTDMPDVELCPDADADGFLASEDCDDNDPDVNPDATEVCNGVDDDCNGSIDDGALDSLTWYLDGDGDGYGVPSVTMEACGQPAGYADNDADCDDSVVGSSPEAPEICEDGVDNDCDGMTDAADSDGCIVVAIVP